jgi:hypothetical protein
VLDGVSGQTAYCRYPAQAFEAAREALDVRIGPNRFTLRSLSLQIDTPELMLNGEATWEAMTPWPVTPLAPGAMGWYGWLPFLECYHGVLSFDHRLHGSLTASGNGHTTAIDLEGGRGYMEKDWGASFPSAWIWLQTNHFSEPGTSLMVSIATIPWRNRSFRGFIVGLWHRGELHRFTTYTGARIHELTIGDERIVCTLENRGRRLELIIHRDEGIPLLGPSRESMGVGVPETLSATVDVRLLDRRREASSLRFADTGIYGGLEVVGAIERLVEGA